MEPSTFRRAPPPASAPSFPSASGNASGSASKLPEQPYRPNKFIPKEGTGTIFDRAVPSDSKHPNFTGDVNIGGVVYRLAGWATLIDGRLRIRLKAQHPNDVPSHQVSS